MRIHRDEDSSGWGWSGWSGWPMMEWMEWMEWMRMSHDGHEGSTGIHRMGMDGDVMRMGHDVPECIMIYRDEDGT